MAMRENRRRQAAIPFLTFLGIPDIPSPTGQYDAGGSGHGFLAAGLGHRTLKGARFCVLFGVGGKVSS